MRERIVCEAWSPQAGVPLRALCLQKTEEYVRQFNEADDEFICGEIGNSHALDWIQAHIPVVDLPDSSLETTYYFRWWTYRKHIRRTATGHILTEFLPDVPWAGRYNTISGAAPHHIAEGRWLRDFPVLEEYLRYWYTESENLNDYSHWLESMARSLYIQLGAAPDGDILQGMLQGFSRRLESNLHASGMFWSKDNREATEFSIGGDGLRVPINCYMAANASGLSWMLRKAGREREADRFQALSGELVNAVNDRLWSRRLGFYTGIHLPERNDSAGDLDVDGQDQRFQARELWGYLPWYFGFAPAGRERAFEQLFDPEGFLAPYGPTTAEQRHPGFGCFTTGEELRHWLAARGERSEIGEKGHECLWNGPSWPFGTSQALTALQRMLQGSHLCGGGKAGYFRLLKTYSDSHRRVLPNGKIVPWIDENLNPFTGEWLARSRLEHWTDGGWDTGKGGYERGKDYNHSTFCDLVISGLFGFGFDEEDVFLQPLIPDEWAYACLLDIPCHGRLYHIIWDRDGNRYGLGKGLHLFKEG